MLGREMCLILLWLCSGIFDSIFLKINQLKSHIQHAWGGTVSSGISQATKPTATQASCLAPWLIHRCSWLIRDDGDRWRRVLIFPWSVVLAGENNHRVDLGGDWGFKIKQHWCSNVFVRVESMWDFPHRRNVAWKLSIHQQYKSNIIILSNKNKFRT